MPKTDKCVDAYIANAKDFAKPILEHAHCRFFLWKGALVFGKRGNAGTGPFGEVHSLASRATGTQAREAGGCAATVARGAEEKHRREYAEWVAEAKTDETRQRRVDTAIEWLAQGKSRNWKYEKK